MIKLLAKGKQQDSNSATPCCHAVVATTMQIKTLLLISVALRACLIAYGELQDRFLSVKYTDIDYSVFTDAARYVSQSQSPFLRSTYRYSPLLAYLLVPNVCVSRIWGKVVFASADILAAWQIWRVGQLQRVSAQRCFWSIMLWLYNPFTVTISTRGSCDSLVTVTLLAVLLMLLQGRRVLPAFVYGLAVHFRIYPIIYAPAIVMYLAYRQLQSGQQQKIPSRFKRAFSWLLAVVRQGIVFGSISGGTFLLLGLVFYQLYGQLFLHEAFLHHQTRKDPRHNFSVYYYPVYLDFMPWPTAAAADGVGDALVAGDTSSSRGSSSSNTLLEGLGPLASILSMSLQQFDALWQQLMKLLGQLPQVDAGSYAFVPQATLLLVFAVTLHRNQPLCWLLQTMAFVAFNKVSTAQYFVWYYSLLPIALQQVPWPLPRALKLAGSAWVLTQLHWLFWGYMLEFQGRGVHLMLWWAGALFLAANSVFMWVLLSSAARASSVQQQGA